MACFSQDSGSVTGRPSGTDGPGRFGSVGSGRPRSSPSGGGSRAATHRAWASSKSTSRPPARGCAHGRAPARWRARRLKTRAPIAARRQTARSCPAQSALLSSGWPVASVHPVQRVGRCPDPYTQLGSLLQHLELRNAQRSGHVTKGKHPHTGRVHVGGCR